MRVIELIGSLCVSELSLKVVEVVVREAMSKERLAWSRVT